MWTGWETATLNEENVRPPAATLAAIASSASGVRTHCRTPRQMRQGASSRGGSFRAAHGVKYDGAYRHPANRRAQSPHIPISTARSPIPGPSEVAIPPYVVFKRTKSSDGWVIGQRGEHVVQPGGSSAWRWLIWDYDLNLLKWFRKSTIHLFWKGFISSKFHGSCESLRCPSG